MTAGGPVAENPHVDMIKCVSAIKAYFISARNQKVFYSVDNILYEFDIWIKVTKIKLVLTKVQGA